VRQQTTLFLGVEWDFSFVQPALSPTPTTLTSFIVQRILNRILIPLIVLEVCRSVIDEFLLKKAFIESFHTKYTED